MIATRRHRSRLAALAALAGLASLPGLARLARLAALAALAIGAVGCTRAAAPPAVTPATPPARETTSAPASTTPVALANLDLKLERRWTGFSAPLWLTSPRDGSGRLFVVEQGGLVKVIAGGRVLDAPYLDLRDLVSSGGERGLLSLVFAPDFKTNGHLYVDYTDRNGDTAIVRYTAPLPTDDAPHWGTPQVVLSVQQPYANHNGGGMHFGPDRMLYIGMGDGGSGGDPQDRAQNRRELLGKMLRLDVGEAGAPPPDGRYAVPGDNPFVGDGSARPEIWSYGLRNPWRFSFDPATGALWIGDVGQDAWEEVDFAPPGSKGQNWGWNRWEGDHAYGASASTRAGFTFPLLEYSHADGESITGGYVYRGNRYPALRGTYLYADFVAGWVGGVRLESPDGQRLARPEKRVLAQTGTKPSSFGVDENDELYLVDYQGAIWSVTAAAK